MQQGKSKLREQLHQYRSNLPAPERITAASAIAQKTTNSNLFKASKNIAIYLPIKNEVDTQELIKKIWADGKNCYLPVVRKESNTLDFYLYQEGDELLLNSYKILEPKTDAKKYIAAQDLDLVIVPILGFDKDCYRLGFGGGYYDRTFAFKNGALRGSKPYLVGIAYAEQKLPALDHEPWDIPVDEIVTEKNKTTSS
jgi:5-formyltetrahydrofolate cyclo-ligase